MCYLFYFFQTGADGAGREAVCAAERGEDWGGRRAVDTKGDQVAGEGERSKIKAQTIIIKAQGASAWG